MRIEPLFNPAKRRRIVPYLRRQLGDATCCVGLWQFRNRHRGERCFVIGNGPSLRIDDLDKLKSEITFAANKIYLGFESTTWRPNYYVAEDDHFVRQHHDEIRRLAGVKFINNNSGGLFKQDHDIIKYRQRPVLGDAFPKFSDNALRVLYCGYMVTYISLQLAYYMGFTRVYLLGVDFDYSQLGDGAAFIHQTQHAHDHFVPNYFEPGEVRATPQLSLAEQAMKCAKEFYEAHGRTIWNATRGGKLEVFDRISLDEVLNH